MKQKELTELSDQELLDKAKKMKSSATIHAFLIGFLIAIVIYSLVKNTWGLLTLIPLFFIYKLTKSSDNHKELKKILRERNLL